MRKLLLILLLGPTPCLAEWKFIASSDTVELYMDLSRMKKDSAWVLYNYKRPQTFSGYPSLGSFRSIIALNISDCGEYKSKPLAINYFRGEMGKGEHIPGEQFKGTWTYAPPNSLLEGELDFFCSRKRR